VAETDAGEKAVHEETERGENDKGGESLHRVFVNVSHLNPGAILRGKTYAESGEPLHEEHHVFTEADIASLKSRGLSRIYYIPIDGDVSKKALAESRDFMSRLMASLKSGKNIDLNQLKSVIAMVMDDIYPRDVGLLTLLTLKSHDEYAYVHSVNVGILAMMLAKKAGMKENDVRDVGLGAFLHDVGKVNTPGDIVWKMDGDTDYEKTIIREHPVFGYSMLKTAGVPEAALNVVLKHHEHFNGSGYPSGLEDPAMEPHVKVVSICNHYDFYVTAINGKKPLTPREAMLRLNGLANTVFNPMMVNAFVREMTRHVLEKPLYPAGSVVLLDTKEIAVVLEVRKDSDIAPLVNIISDMQGRKLARPIKVDLLNDKNRAIARVIKIPE